MYQEAKITINETTISDAQASVIRVALENFVESMVTDGLGNDQHGIELAELYKQRADEIRALLYNKD
ncbi:hypothetical protein [Shewanella sp.]|uniref:hypothetical protein n=1 Tax=Shewanella sp. TaxID=50422 RepID=UPI003A988586